MAANSVAVDTPEWVVPGAPSPPEGVGVGTLPGPVPVVAYPYAVVVVSSSRLPPVGVGAFENAPVAGNMRDGVWVVVPVVIVAVALVQVGVTNEVEDPFDLVDKILLSVESIAVFMQCILVAPGAQFSGDRVGAKVLVHSERAMRLRRTRAAKQADKQSYSTEK